MRPFVWWVQDHLGLAAVGLFGIAAVVVAIVIAASGGSSDAPAPRPKMAASAQISGNQRPSHESAAETEAQPTQRHRAHPAAAHDRRKARQRKAEHAHAGEADKPSTKSKSDTADATQEADNTPARQSKGPQPSESGQHSLDQATAEKVAAAHPGTSCPQGYTKKQCEEAVRAAVDPAPSIPVTQPSDCTKAMSEAQCEELFAAEAAAREAGSGAILPQECIEDPEQAKCAAVVEEMKAQYEAAHPGG